MKKAFLLPSLVIGFSTIALNAFAEFPKVIFEENKNQWPAQVKMKADIAGGALFLEKHTFTYLLKENIDWHGKHRNESGGPVTQKMHSFKVNFENADPNTEVTGNNRYSWHRNYYLGNDKSKWADNVPVYAMAYYRDLYQHIDLQYYNDEANNLKYDIIIQPGGNHKNIKMNYVGTDGMSMQNGHLFVKTTIYDIIEQKPYAYQVINGNKVQVPCNYLLNGTTVTFDLGNYDHALPIIIDPTVIASTYTGSTGDNWGFTATYDAQANIYIGGICGGTGYPYTTGAWDSTYNGGSNAAGSWPFDISLSKLTPNGSALMFSTYYGGLVNEQPHSLVVNSSNELYVVGRTNSNNFPTLGPYQAAIAGGYDIILGRFNSTGGLLASTYLGGTSDDCVNVSVGWDTYGTTKFSYTDDGRSEIILDGSGNVYVAACTKSTNFPTANPYQAAFGGVQDAVVFKMPANLSTLTWSTYLGGTGTDAAYGLKLNNSGHVYVTGGTTGANFPTTGSVLYPTYQGGLCDAFISVFNTTLVGPAQLLRSTFLGTTAYDQTYMIEIDASGDLYVLGQTQGAYPTTAGVYKNNNSGLFVHKVTGSLASTVFSTTIGTGPAVGTPAVNLSPTAFLVDSCQTIYIAGWGRSSMLSAFMPSPSSTIGMPLTTNAFQSTTDGRDHYFMVLEPDAQGLFYATFYGENAAGNADHVDGGTCRFDKRGVIYQACCASCGGTQGFPINLPALSSSNNSNHINAPLPTSPNQTVFNCNEAVVKMDVAVNPVAQASITGATTGCAPFVVNFSNAGSNADNYIWDFGEGGISFQSAPSYTYNFAGTYTITLYAIDSIGICGYIDTSKVAITVGQKPTVAPSVTPILCNGGTASATVTPTGGILPYTYAWSPSGGNSSAASNLGPNTYTVSVTDNTGCTTTQTIQITQPPPLTVNTTTVGAACGQSNGSATATAGGGTPGYSYSWNTGQSSSAISGIASGTYIITVTDANGCTTAQTINIPTTNGPTVQATATNSVSCNGGSNGSATAFLIGGTAPYTYLWTPGGLTTPTANNLVAGSYVITITDSAGCSGSANVIILEPTPLVITVSTQSVSCFGGSNGSATANVAGGTPGYSYTWGTSPPQSGQTANNLPTGNYLVTVTDANGCTGLGTGTIQQPASAMQLSTSQSGTSCGGAANGVLSVTVTPNTGTPPYAYNWSNGGTTPTVSNVVGGSYNVTVTDANGCTAVSAVTMPTHVQPTAAFTEAPSITCDGIAYQFTSTSQNAQTHYWNVPGVGSSTSPNPGFVFPYNGTYNVTLIVTNPPCADTLTKPITIGGLGSNMLFKEANVFTPNGDLTNDCFHPAMINQITGKPDEVLLPCTYLEVFDRWGVKMYESIGANGINCWNGNNKNDSKPAPDGTYYWIAKLGETTIKGYVTLARHK